MARAKKIVSGKDASGREVFQVLVPRAEDDPVSIGLRLLTFHLQQQGKSDRGGGMFGGEFGYGVNFENDAFMMHRYCWCEKDDCLWCGGSCGCGEPYIVGHAIDGRRVSKEEYEEWLATIEQPLPWKATNAVERSAEYRSAQVAFDRYIEERDRRSTHIWPAVVHTCAHHMFHSRPVEDRPSGLTLCVIN
jgi:hypothetical protein